MAMTHGMLPLMPKQQSRSASIAKAKKDNKMYIKYNKRIARNIYADSEEECEVKLEALIREMKAEFWIR